MSFISIKKRSDFLTIRNQGKTAVAKGLILQTLPHPTLLGIPPSPTRVGLVVSKKMGNAVIRNRIRRRLRALCSDVIRHCANPKHDYVLIARGATLDRPFEYLKKDFKFTLHTTETFLTPSTAPIPPNEGGLR